MKKLILGGTGLIGSNFRDSIQLSKKDVDLTNYNDTIKCFKSYKPDIIVHAATKKINSTLMYKYPTEYLYDNITMSLNIFKAAKKCNIQRLIVFGSINAFLEHNNKLLQSDSYNQRLKNMLSQLYDIQYKLNSKVIYLSNVYGPCNDYTNNGIIPIVIDKCFNAILENKNLLLKGTGLADRTFTYVNDIVEITEKLINDKNNNPVIISSDEKYSLKDIVAKITKLMNFQGDIIWDGKEVDNIYTKEYDTSIKKYSGEYNYTSINNGLKKTIQSY